LTYAVLGCHIDGVRLLIGRNTNVMTKESYMWTLLHQAAYIGSKEIVEELLRYTISIETKTIDNYTPLHETASQGHLEIVQLLVAKGAKVHVINKFGETSLETAFFR